MQREPKRHHYIPQFILRRFVTESGELDFFDVNLQTSSVKKPVDVFVKRNLYRDAVNNPEDPVRLEKDLARYEQEVSDIIKRFAEKDEVIISVKEEESLRLFLAIMGFRSARVQREFGNDAQQEFKDFYSIYQDDGNLMDFWRRNLKEVVNCRSFSEINQSKNIDDPIKLFMFRDMNGFFGMYFMCWACGQKVGLYCTE